MSDKSKRKSDKLDKEEKSPQTDGKEEENKFHSGSQSDSNGIIKTQALKGRKVGHDSSEAEDNFEELETQGIQLDEPALNVNDYVTIWMNSWIDEDDGDFDFDEAFNDNELK